MRFSTFTIASVLLGLVTADWQFRSRPDLSVPILNITVPANNTSPGYLFLTPFSGFASNGVSKGPRQAAPYIYDDSGELIWSGFTYFSIWAVNFQVAQYHDEDILFSFEGSHNPNYGHGHGHVTFLNQNYETIKEVRAGNSKLQDKHEFHIKDGKTGLLEIYQPVPYDLSPWADSPEQQWIIDAIFQEIDLDSGEVLFEWSSLDHVSPSDSLLPVNEGEAGKGYNSSTAWDYFHINSVEKDQNGDYLISARHAAALYKINGTTGEIIWKLGGLPGLNTSDFKLKDKFTFSFQHHARIISTNGSKEVISFFDNSAHGSEEKGGHVVKYNDESAGRIIEIDTETWDVKLLYSVSPPDKLLAKSQGSTQVLKNGNVLVNWGSEGAVSEYDREGNLIFNTYLDSGEQAEKVQQYRAFKYEWKGYPNEKIAVLSEVADEETTIFVSWNGDTNTKYWKFYESNGKRLLGQTDKKGFETRFTTNLHIEKVFVESYDSNHKLLGTSDLFKTRKQVVLYEAHQKVSFGEKFQSYFSWRRS